MLLMDSFSYCCIAVITFFKIKKLSSFDNIKHSSGSYNEFDCLIVVLCQRKLDFHRLCFAMEIFEKKYSFPNIQFDLTKIYSYTDLQTSHVYIVVVPVQFICFCKNDLCE